MDKDIFIEEEKKLAETICRIDEEEKQMESKLSTSYNVNDIAKGFVMQMYAKKINDIKKYLFSCGYDVTLINSAGAFTKKEKELLMCSLPNLSYHKVKEVLKEIDKNVFIVVTSAYEQKNANREINKLTLGI